MSIVVVVENVVGCWLDVVADRAKNLVGELAHLWLVLGVQGASRCLGFAHADPTASALFVITYMSGVGEPLPRQHPL